MEEWLEADVDLLSLSALSQSEEEMKCVLKKPLSSNGAMLTASTSQSGAKSERQLQRRTVRCAIHLQYMLIHQGC